MTIPSHVIEMLRKVRARFEAEPIAARIPREIDTQFDHTLFDGPDGSYISAIRRSTGSKLVMLVGHNPMIEETAILLCGSRDPGARRKLLNGFPTGGLAVIELPGALAEVRPGAGNLVMFITGGAI